LIRHVGKGRGEDAERCPQHNQEELSVYCDTCQACICSKCALFGQHVGHKHLPVDDVYKKHYHLLIADGNRLRKHLLAVASMGKKVDKSVERVRIERKNHEEIMKVALDQIMKRFEKTTNDKMRQLSEVREKLSESSDRIQLFMADLDEKMKTGSKKELVSQSSSLKQKLSHFLQGLDPLPVNDNELSKISSFTKYVRTVCTYVCMVVRFCSFYVDCTLFVLTSEPILMSIHTYVVCISVHTYNKQHTHA
jgi:hypothetical protein